MFNTMFIYFQCLTQCFTLYCVIMLKVLLSKIQYIHKARLCETF